MSRCSLRRPRGGSKFWCLPLLGLLLPATQAWSQVSDPATQQLLRQQERERVLRTQAESRPDVRLERALGTALDRLPSHESPCFPIRRIALDGEAAARFAWALQAADPATDPATGRCLGTAGVGTVLRRVQNAIVARGFVTTRVLASPQDLKTGVLTLTLVPGRIHAIRFAVDSDPRATAWNAVPAHPGELLNLRDVEQALENFKRVPTVEADIRIVPAEGPDARPGESDLVIGWFHPRTLRLGLTLDDSGSQSTGRLQAGATVSVDDLLHANDLFYVNLGRSVLNGDRKGTSSWTAHYDVPFGYWLVGATSSGYDYRQTVDGPYQSFSYRGSSRNAELRVARGLHRNATAKTGAYASAWWRESNNYIDDTEIEVQRRRTAGWELGLTHKQFIGKATLDASLAYRRGSGAFGALRAPEEPFGEGVSHARTIVADLRLAVPFAPGQQQWRYSLDARAQWNRAPLVPQDRFAIGGRYTVRGFDGEASLSGDRGWLLRNELDLSLGGGQEGYLGIDYGRIGGPSTQRPLCADPGCPAQRSLGLALAGAVVGLRGGWHGLAWDLFVGAPLSKPRNVTTAPVTTGFSLSAAF